MATYICRRIVPNNFTAAPGFDYIEYAKRETFIDAMKGIWPAIKNKENISLVVNNFRNEFEDNIEFSTSIEISEK